jgi:hypothetical protein
VIVFRNTDADVPFFWDSDRQPPARWHGEREGPAQYTSSTPDACWAEFLRHTGITDPDDLAGIERAIWAIEIPDDEAAATPILPPRTLTGGPRSYRRCRREAARLRAGGATRLVAPSAAVLPGTPSGWLANPGLTPATARDEQTIVLFGPRPELVGWVAAVGRPMPSLLPRVRHLR